MKWTILFLTFIFFNIQAEEHCSQSAFDKADAMLSSLSSWQAVDKFFTQHKDCDVGYLREGTDEKIVRLLVDKWGQLNALSALVKRKPALGDYVADHISETLGDTDVEKVRDYAASNCQIEDKALCKKLHDAAVETLKRMALHSAQQEAKKQQEADEIKVYQPAMTSSI